MRLGPRVLLAVVLILLVSAGPAAVFAQDYRYVSDKLQVTVRTGATTGHSIIYLVNSGTRLEVLEDNEEGWVRVRSSEGREGWMLARYLQKDKTAALKLKELDPQTNNLAKKVEQLTAENQEMRQELDKNQKQATDLNQRYEKLKGIATEHISLQQEHEQLRANFEAQQKQLDEVSAEAESMKFGSNLKWFLAGAGVLILGWILGMAFAKRKRRASSLY